MEYDKIKELREEMNKYDFYVNQPELELFVEEKLKIADESLLAIREAIRKNTKESLKMMRSILEKIMKELKSQNEY